MIFLVYNLRRTKVHLEIFSLRRIDHGGHIIPVLAEKIDTSYFFSHVLHKRVENFIVVIKE